MSDERTHRGSDAAATGEEEHDNGPQNTAVEQAIETIGHYIAERLTHRYSPDHRDPNSIPADWVAVVEPIARDPLSIGADLDRYRTLGNAVATLPDTEAQDALRSALAAWEDAYWPLIEQNVKEKVLSAFKDNHPSNQAAFSTHLRRWPRLANDRELLQNVLSEMDNSRVALELALPRLTLLNGDADDLERVLVPLVCPQGVRSKLKDHERRAIAILINRWGRGGAWSALNRWLWNRRDEMRAFGPTNSSSDVAGAAALLDEFGLSIGAKADYTLGQLSAETKAAWRNELIDLVGDDDELRAAVCESLMWYAPTELDRAVVLAVAGLLRNQTREVLDPLLAHSAPLVRRRAATVAGLMDGRVDVGELLLARARPASGSVEPTGARTWIGDVRTERLITETLEEAASDFADEVRETRGSGEETLVAILFDRLRGALKTVSKRLEALAAEHDADSMLRFRLEHRIVGKAEEGGPGVGSARFSTDVCIVFKAFEDRRLFARRASLVQAKRLHVRGSGLDVDFYPVDINQISDIAQQTFASFMLLVGPREDGVTMPAIPARLFLDLVERGASSSSISPAVGARLGKSISEWMLTDVIGMWTGDHRADVVEKAAGADGKRPFLLVEVDAQRVSRGPDGWISEGSW